LTFFSLLFLKYVLGRWRWAFLGKGSWRGAEFKNTTIHTICFCKKSMSNFVSKTSTKISMSGSPRLFCFIEFLGVFQRRDFKSTTKNVLQKNRVGRLLQQIRPKTKNPKPIFSRFCFITVFGRFSVRGVRENKSDSGPFWASDPPTHHGGTGVPVVFFGGPLRLEVGTIYYFEARRA
jgi:hypothetical protein